MEENVFVVFSPVSNIYKKKYTERKPNHLLIWIVIHKHSRYRHFVLLLVGNTGF